MNFYSEQKRFFFAVDCVLFGYDGEGLQVLLLKRISEPLKGKWSLIGKLVDEKQSADDAAKNLLKSFTGRDNLYAEQLHAFTDIGRETSQRKISLTYMALINIQEYVH